MLRLIRSIQKLVINYESETNVKYRISSLNESILHGMETKRILYWIKNCWKDILQTVEWLQINLETLSITNVHLYK